MCRRMAVKKKNIGPYHKPFYLNYEINFNYTKYYCTVPYEYWETGMDVLSDIVWFNTIPKNEFNKDQELEILKIKLETKELELTVLRNQIQLFNSQLIKY